MESLSSYLPIDRYLALQHNRPLPDTARGAALFADLSGFTPLTDALVERLGPLQGAEELTRWLNEVYDALIGELNRYGGSVICFSGDAITCWLEGDDGVRAVACGLAMQSAMRRFAHLQVKVSAGGPEYTISLHLKVAVAAGPVRRFQVGDPCNGSPAIQKLDVLAGRTVERLSAAERLARKGEVLVEPRTAAALTGKVAWAEWRRGEPGEPGYGVVAFLLVPVSPRPWPQTAANSAQTGGVPDEILRPWLLPPVFARLQSGQGEFLAEFRHAACLFLRFGDIDYDSPAVNAPEAGAGPGAGQELNGYICTVQTILEKYQGSLIQLTTGDKGTYLQAAFGAPIALEDYARRAVAAAADLVRIGDMGPVQIGLSLGRMRTGAYGSWMRRTYGVLGSETNLAARLMMAAAPGQVLASQAVYAETQDAFEWEILPPMQVKGRSGPVRVARLVGSATLPGARQRSERSGHSPGGYILPMVGRRVELERLRAALEGITREGKGRILGVIGEAGLGKSRLVAEALQGLPLPVFLGECSSYGLHTSYLVWSPIWRQFFGLDTVAEEQRSRLESLVAELDPGMIPRLPLLSSLLGLDLPENDLTRSMDARLRKGATESLLVDLLAARARRDGPLVLVLENAQWIDPLSADLLDAIGLAIEHLPVCILIVQRPPASGQASPELILRSLPYYGASDWREIRLTEFSAEETGELIGLKLSQLYGEGTLATPPMVELLASRSQGNPFYIGELVNYLHARGVQPDAVQDLSQLDLPASLHSLVLSRLDQRTESQKVTLKVASVIGRIFAAAWLLGAYPELGDPQRVSADLDALTLHNLTELRTSEQEQAEAGDDNDTSADAIYLFKHLITQEVTYDSLPFATRAILHEQLALFIEQNLADTQQHHTSGWLDLLAYHFERSRNTAKALTYLGRAGDAAAARYANAAAIQYYQKLLARLTEPEQPPVLLKLGQVEELAGEWDTARERYERGLELAERLGDELANVRCQAALGELFRKRGAYNEAVAWLARARQGFERLGDLVGWGQVLHSQGTLAAQQGDVDASQALYEESLEIRRRTGETPQIANLMNNLGIVARMRGDLETARAHQAEGLRLRREIGDRFGIAASLNNLGNLAHEQGDISLARAYLEESLAIQREIGSKFYTANALNNLGNVLRAQGESAAAGRCYAESLSLNRYLGDGWAIAYLLEDIASLAAASAEAERALVLAAAASALRERTGAPLSQKECDRLAAQLQPAYDALSPERQSASHAHGAALSLSEAIEFALSGLPS